MSWRIFLRHPHQAMSDKIGYDCRPEKATYFHGGTYGLLKLRDFMDVRKFPDFLEVGIQVCLFLYLVVSWKQILEVSWNRGTRKSSTLIGFSLINHPFCGTTILGNPIWSFDLFVVWIEHHMYCIQMYCRSRRKMEGHGISQRISNCIISSIYLVIVRFPEIGVPPVTIHFRLRFSLINHPLLGYPDGYWNPFRYSVLSQLRSPGDLNADFRPFISMPMSMKK